MSRSNRRMMPESTPSPPVAPPPPGYPTAEAYGKDMDCRRRKRRLAVAALALAVGAGAGEAYAVHRWRELEKAAAAPPLVYTAGILLMPDF